MWSAIKTVGLSLQRGMTARRYGGSDMLLLVIIIFGIVLPLYFFWKDVEFHNELKRRK